MLEWVAVVFGTRLLSVLAAAQVTAPAFVIKSDDNTGVNDSIRPVGAWTYFTIVANASTHRLELDRSSICLHQSRFIAERPDCQRRQIFSCSSSPLKTGLDSFAGHSSNVGAQLMSQSLDSGHFLCVNSGKIFQLHQHALVL